jgi:putative transposase
VHLIAVPESEIALRQAIGEAHRRYTWRINFRERWRGHLWQGRFTSFVMDEPYLLAAARYIELNPVRARLALDAGQFRRSSAATHLAGKGDLLVKVSPLLNLVGDWRALLNSGLTVEAYWDILNCFQQNQSRESRFPPVSEPLDRSGCVYCRFLRKF